VKSKKIRDSARMAPCQVREVGICNGNPETVVFAHVNGGGMGMKNSDLFGAYACSSCHSWLDGGYIGLGHDRAYRDLSHLEAVMRTQKILLNLGYVTIS